MNFHPFRRGLTSGVFAAVVVGWLLASFSGQADPSIGRAVIRDIRAVGNQLRVTVTVPAGQRRISLETRPRLQRGAWTPREVRWSDGMSGEITFTLPLGDHMELVRVQDDEPQELGLPTAFFSGPKEFAGSVSADPYRYLGPVNGSVPGTEDAAGGGADRAVVESDIWQFEGPTLYFFNQQRGLQVIDLTQPDAPVLRGTLPLATWGEQMYRLPAADSPGVTWLALLAQQGCDNNSEVLLVRVAEGHPTLAGRLPVRGQVRESRLVGHALYVASYEWIQVPPVEVRDAQGNVIGYQYAPWESRTVVSAFDLATPATPVIQEPVSVAAAPDAIAATDRYLFVATTGTVTPDPNVRVASWALLGNHGVLVFDISNPHGATTHTGTLLSAGRVADKFKLNLRDDVLTVVSQKDGVGQWVTRPNPKGEAISEWVWAPPQAVLETFSLADPREPIRLGGITLITNESVFASRFDGDRAYVVTFRRVDPLWIVDLKDPVNPRVTAELEVPGFSNYLHPLGDRLLAMGVENGRAAVSLFDVADAGRPALLSKILLGEGWSDSEANRDEKAFQVFPEAGLVLVPWSGQRAAESAGPTGAPWFQGVQLVDLADRTLTARGVIDHVFQARRATLRGDRIVSISAQELLSVEATDRDHPQVRATLALAPEVDRVLVAGTRLVQVRNGGNQTPELTLTTTDDADAPLARLVLGGAPIAGATWRDGLVYVLQVKADEWRYEAINVTNRTITEIDRPPFLVTNESVVTSWNSFVVPGETRLTVVEAGSDTLRLRGEVTLANPSNFFGGGFQALWPREGVLVWTEDANPARGGPVYADGPALDAMPGIPGAGWGFWSPWWWGSNIRHFLAFEVGPTRAPSVASVITLGTQGEAGGFGPATVADGKVFSSHNDLKLVWVTPPPADPTVPREPGVKPGLDPLPVQQWESSWWLDVLDYADATEPVIRPPASLPGELLGVSHAGQMLYARGPVAGAPDGSQALGALAYDGLTASLVSSLPLPNTWPQPLTVGTDGVVWLGRSGSAAPETPTLETWSVTVGGHFARLGSVAESRAVTELLPLGDLLVASDGMSWFQFFDPQTPGSLTPVGVAPRPCGLWISAGGAAASRATGLWLPRGTSGLWHVPVGP